MTKEEAFEKWLYINNNKVVTDWDLIKQTSSWELFDYGWEAGFRQRVLIKEAKDAKR